MSNKFKKVTAGLLMMACLVAAGGSMIPSTAQAGVIKQRTYSTSPSVKNDVKYLTKHTTFSKDEISDLLAKGFNKTDIENIYMLRSFAPQNVSFEELLNRYKKAGKNVETILIQFGVDTDE